MRMFSFISNKAKPSKVMTQAKAPFHLSDKNAWLLWCCQCLNITLISVELSSWMLAIIALSFLWQAFLLNKNNPFSVPLSLFQNTQQSKLSAIRASSNNKNVKPINDLNPSYHSVSPALLAAFAVAGCVAITLTAKAMGVLIAMVHLLAFAYALKAFELKKRSDFYQVFLLGLFLVGAAFIFKQSLGFVLLAFVVLIVNLSVLYKFYTNNLTMMSTFKHVTLLLTQSMVLATVLFFIFPRLSPFWQVPQANSATTGLSDRVAPGDIAKLARSSKLAFRVNFTEGDLPPYSQLYWRAMVLEN
mgnify:CR=1 FL=1